MKASDLELDWELGVFRALRGLWRGLRSATSPTVAHSGRAALLEDHLAALTPLAQLIAGEPVRVLPARGEGGVRGRDLLLPPALDLGPDAEVNRGLYVLRAAHAAAIRRLRLADAPDPDPVVNLRASLAAARAAADWLATDLPRFGPAWQEACALACSGRDVSHRLRGRAHLEEELRLAALRGQRPWEDDAPWVALARARATGPSSPPVPLWGRLLVAAQDAPAVLADTDSPPAASEGAEIDAPPMDDLSRVVLDEKAQDDWVLQHSFEKIETADDHQGQSRLDDGADELLDHLEALEELDLGKLVRGGEQARSIYRTDVRLDVDIPDVQRIEPDERGIPYDEWDFRARRYRPGWCTVYPSPVPQTDGAWAAAATRRHRRTIERLRRQLEIHRAGRERIGRQRDGEDVDIDAVVDNHATVAAGHQPSERLYSRHLPRRRTWATTVLLDLSLSADAWVADQRVLDVSRESVLVLGEVADQLGDQLQVLAFASSTRNRCRVWGVKDWRDPWKKARGRLGALRPQGYTRIGPAIRHGTDQLVQSGAERRLLLLISDGKPNDYDRYEGRYGMADVRMAVREAERAGVVLHALALDPGVRSTLPALVGAGAWHVISSPAELPATLTTVYGRLTGG